MQKDYTAVVDSLNSSEIDFVEAYWSNVWGSSLKDLAGLKNKFSKTEEFKIMAPYLAKFDSSSRIFDAGCGVGQWTIGLSSMGYEVIGMDISKDVINALKDQYPSANFLNGDIRRTGLPSNHFDAVISWGVFEHFESGPQDCFEEAFRLLKPGGYLFISVPFHNLRQSIITALKGSPSPQKKIRFYQYRFTKPEIAKEIFDAGFDVLSLNLIHKRQGVLRSLQHELGMPCDWLISRLSAFVISPLVPSKIFSHMMFAVCKKPICLNQDSDSSHSSMQPDV